MAVVNKEGVVLKRHMRCMVEALVLSGDRDRSGEQAGAGGLQISGRVAGSWSTEARTGLSPRVSRANRPRRAAAGSFEVGGGREAEPGDSLRAVSGQRAVRGGKLRDGSAAIRQA